MRIFLIKKASQNEQQNPTTNINYILLFMSIYKKKT